MVLLVLPIQCSILASRLGFYENSPGLDDGMDRIIRWTGVG